MAIVKEDFWNKHKLFIWLILPFICILTFYIVYYFTKLLYIPIKHEGLSGVIKGGVFGNKYGNIHIELFSKTWFVVLGISILLDILIALIIAIAYYIHADKNEKLHGNASFLTEKEIIKEYGYKDTNKFGKLCIGNIKVKQPFIKRLLGSPKYIVEKCWDITNTFVLIVAGTRRGKGVGFGIPAHINWEHSLISLDIKGESADITSRYRLEKLNQKVYVFDPEDINSSRWNPMGYIKVESNEEITNLQQLAGILYPDNKNDSFWSESARNIFIGISLLLYDLRKVGLLNVGYTIQNVLLLATNSISPSSLTDKARKLSSSYSDDVKKKLKENKPLTFIELMDMTKVFNKLNNVAWGEIYEENGLRYYTGIRQKTMENLNSFIQMLESGSQTAENQRSSFSQPLAIYNNDVLREVMSKNDFDFHNLRREKTTIYLRLSPNAMQTYPKLINLFFSQLMMINLDEQPVQNKELKYQVLLLMDEFASLKRVVPIESSVSYMAGYGLKLALIIQSVSQLEDSTCYGKEASKTMLANIATQVLFSPNDNEDAKRISERLGKKTVVSESVSYSSKFNSDLNFSQSDQARDLLTIDEIMTLDTRTLVFRDKVKPSLLNLNRYFDDEDCIKAFKSVDESIANLDVLSGPVWENAIQTKKLYAVSPKEDNDSTYNSADFIDFSDHIYLRRRKKNYINFQMEKGKGFFTKVIDYKGKEKYLFGEKIQLSSLDIKGFDEDNLNVGALSSNNESSNPTQNPTQTHKPLTHPLETLVNQNINLYEDVIEPEEKFLKELPEMAVKLEVCLHSKEHNNGLIGASSEVDLEEVRANMDKVVSEDLTNTTESFSSDSFD